jgi:hypothetical protein
MPHQYAKEAHLFTGACFALKTAQLAVECTPCLCPPFKECSKLRLSEPIADSMPAFHSKFESQEYQTNA